MYFKLKIKNYGFTFIEFMVVMTIAIVILTTLIFQQSRWNDKLAINTQVYELAMMVRQAQVYGLGVKEYTAGSGDKFDTGYGIYINVDNNDRYIFFADANKNGRYDFGEEIETKTLNGGIYIDRFCGRNGAIEKCTPFADSNRLAVTFLRPEPQASITVLNEDGHMVTSMNPPAIIYLRSREGLESSVKVELNGQVSIQ